VVVSNPNKIRMHARVLEDWVDRLPHVQRWHPLGLMMKEDSRRKDLWGSILCGLKKGQPGGVILPDTVTDFPPSAAENVTSRTIAFGCFIPPAKDRRRFSMMQGDRIATKEAGTKAMVAWGVVLWGAEVTDYLLTLDVDHYDRAFELAMLKFDRQLFTLNYYHDLGTFEAYKTFLNQRDPIYDSN